MKTNPTLLYFSSCLLITGLLGFIGVAATAQDTISNSFPTDYFQPPLDLPLYLSGNFGEIRSNHFHMGLDIKTGGKEGAKVLAAAEGYVSRIKISTSGYGKALYITHPNGYTTVYAHLQRYSESIEAYVRKAQYAQQNFTIELFPAPGELPVKAGELVALSGNTGGSGGPHLHFEIRDTESEAPINPLLFNFKVTDNVKPIFQTLAVYPMSTESQVNRKPHPVFLKVSGSNGKYKLDQSVRLSAFGKVGFGVQVLDRMNSTRNTYGVYTVELYGNNELIYKHKVDQIGYDESRFINVHTDYSEYKRNKRKVQKSFLVPTNRLKIYENVENDGLVLFPQDSIFDYKYVISDVAGNQSELSFQVKAAKPMPFAMERSNVESKTFKYYLQNTIKRNGIEVTVPPFALYNDVEFEFKQEPASLKSITPVYHVHNSYEPLHDYIKLAIRLPKLSEERKKQALIVSLTKGGKVLAPEGGSVEGQIIRVRTRSLGPYTVMVDSIAPRISSIDLANGASLRGQSNIRFKITDGLSGIDRYDAFINDKWVLMEYDKKSKLITYTLDPNEIHAGENKFFLEVKDKKGNKKQLRATFQY